MYFQQVCLPRDRQRIWCCWFVIGWTAHLYHYPPLRQGLIVCLPHECLLLYPPFVRLVFVIWVYPWVVILSVLSWHIYVLLLIGVHMMFAILSSTCPTLEVSRATLCPFSGCVLGHIDALHLVSLFI